LGVALIAVTAALIYLSLRARPTPAANETAMRVLAVLPFKPLQATDADEYLELGMADALITKLSRMNQVTVRPTSSVRKFSGTAQDAVAAGHLLNHSEVSANAQRIKPKVRKSLQ
jgi:TolB-like protein